MSECTLKPSATSASYAKNADSFLVLETDDQNRVRSEQTQHVVPVRTTGARLPLFCIFPGPPGSSEFIEFMPNDQPLYDFYFTKLDGSANFPQVEQLAQAFLSEIREIQPHGPYYICGYSKAGLVAYEIARLLSKEGEAVPLLALFETWHPGFEKNLTGSELVQFHLLHIAERLQKYGRDLFHGKLLAAADVAWKGVSRRMRKIGWRLARKFFKGSSQPVPNGMQQVEAIVVLKSFVPKRYAHPIVLVRIAGSFERKLKDRTLGWHMCATGGIEVYFAPGDNDHGTLMTKPHVRHVIERIKPYLVGPHET